MSCWSKFSNVTTSAIMATFNDADIEEVKPKPAIQRIERSLPTTESGRSISGALHLPSIKSIFKQRSKERPIVSAEPSRHVQGDSEVRSIAASICDQSLYTLPLSLSTISHLKFQRISQQQDKPQVYMLHISTIFQDQSFSRYAVGSPPLSFDPSILTSERVLMLVGATGTGKTTLINGISNYIYGTKWVDDIRLKVIHNESRQSQAYGQTKHISAYTFPMQTGSPLPYTLTVIDTPGFGDSQGLRHDRQLVEQINTFFSVSPPGGIAHLHGIGFVVKASDN